MTTIPRLQRISASDLDSLIADLKQREARILVLCGHEVNNLSSTGHWPEIWHKSPVVYLLKEHVPDLAHRISKLRQLTCLDLSYNWIGPDGASSLGACRA